MQKHERSLVSVMLVANDERAVRVLELNVATPIRFHCNSTDANVNLFFLINVKQFVDPTFKILQERLKTN